MYKIRWIVLLSLFVLLTACGGGSDEDGGSSNNDDNGSGEAAVVQPSPTPEPQGLSLRTTLGQGAVRDVIWNDAGIFVQSDTAIYRYDPVDITADPQVYDANVGVILTLSFNADASSMVIGTDEIGPSGVRLRVIDVASGETTAQATNSRVSNPNGAVFNPNNADEIYVVSRGGDANVINLASDELTIEADGAHQAGFGLPGFLPDGETILTSGESDIKVWSADLSAATTEINPEDFGRLTSRAISPDGSTLLLTSLFDGKAVLWDIATNEEIPFLENRGEDTGVMVGDITGDRVAIGYSVRNEASVIVYDYEATEIATMSGHVGRVVGVSFSPDESQIASVGFDGTLRVWDAASGEEVAMTGNFTTPVVAATISADGRTVATTSVTNEVAQVWDVASGESSAFADPDPCCGVAFEDVQLNPDGSIIYLSANNSGQSDRFALKAWDVASGELSIILTELGAVRTNGIAINADGNLIGIVGNNAGVAIYNVETDETTIITEEEARPRSLSISPDGTHIAYIIGTETYLYDISAAEQANVFSFEVEFGGMGEVSAITQDNQTAAMISTSDNALYVGRDATADSEIVLVNDVFEARATTVTISPDGAYAVVGSISGDITIVDMADLSIVVAITDVHKGRVADVAFSADGTALMTAGGAGDIMIWDVELGE